MRLARQFSPCGRVQRTICSHQHRVQKHISRGTSQLDNDDDEKVGQQELDWITWQRDYMQNRSWLESRTNILEAMQCNLVK